MDQLPRLGKGELICLLLVTCNYVVSVWRGFLFLWVLWMGYVILLWHSLSLPYNYFMHGTTHTQHNINKLEMVQRRTVQFVTRDISRTSSVTVMLAYGIFNGLLSSNRMQTNAGQLFKVSLA